MTDLTLAQRIRVYAASGDDKVQITLHRLDALFLASTLEREERVGAALSELKYAKALIRARAARAEERLERVIGAQCLVAAAIIGSPLISNLIVTAAWLLGGPS